MEFPKMPEMPNFPDHPGVFATPPAPGTPAEPFTWHFRNDRQIGVSVTPLTKQLSDHFGVTNGALINNVREDSPAAKAGLKAGDIIVEVEGIEIKGDFDIIRAIGEKKEGDVSVTFVRDRNRQTVRVTPEKGKGAFDMYFERSEPGKPGEMRLLRPAPHPAPAPVPLNQMVFPGRVV
jgi:membrane-associated protease RseP (regulator of RpoE activity)